MTVWKQVMTHLFSFPDDTVLCGLCDVPVVFSGKEMGHGANYIQGRSVLTFLVGRKKDCTVMEYIFGMMIYLDMMTNGHCNVCSASSWCGALHRRSGTAPPHCTTASSAPSSCVTRRRSTRLWTRPRTPWMKVSTLPKLSGWKVSGVVSSLWLTKGNSSWC